MQVCARVRNFNTHLKQIVNCMCMHVFDSVFVRVNECM